MSADVANLFGWDESMKPKGRGDKDKPRGSVLQMGSETNHTTMTTPDDAQQATPPQILREQIMSFMIPKNEREHWAATHIEKIERELTEATATTDRQNAQLLAAEKRVIELTATNGLLQTYEAAVRDWTTIATKEQTELAAQKQQAVPKADVQPLLDALTKFLASSDDLSAPYSTDELRGALETFNAKCPMP